MSDALRYLAEARPEAMGHYFKFLKLSGGKLDPKTRALISVVSKVFAQTETGLRQYVVRALAAGATADEILDAMLAAFPMLGLSRIVWAIDVLLAMDLPEFRLEELGQHASWHAVGKIAEFPADATVERVVDDVRLWVRNAASGVQVWHAHCPHQRTALVLEPDADDCVTCPRHGWRFNLVDGACVAVGDRPLDQVRHDVRDGDLLVYW